MIMNMNFFGCRGAASLRPHVGKTKTGRTAVHPCKKPIRNQLPAILAACFLLFLAAVPVYSAIIQAASCSQQDVQAAIDLAQDGDTVLVPAGTAIWAGRVNLVNKAIVLKGAGIGITVIHEENTSSLLRLSGAEGKPFRVTGFSFYFNNQAVGVLGASKSWRIDNCLFSSDSFRVAIMTGSVNDTGYSYGLIDNCQFYNSRVMCFEGNNGHESWKRPLGLGTDTAVYVEDCVFDFSVFGNAIDANHGGRYVFRYNQLYNVYIEAHSLSNSWTNPWSFARATRKYEIYNNTFTTDGPLNHFMAMRLRGGTGVVFENRVQHVSGDRFNGVVAIDNVRSYEDRGQVLGRCNGSHPLDGNEEPSGWPCLDQIGTSTDFGPGENRLPQQREPLYAWDNLMDGVYAPVLVINDPFNLRHIQNSRDYVEGIPKPGYTPFTYPHPLRTSGFLADGNTQTITLTSGWNWVSFNVLPADRSLDALFGGILGQVEQVRTQNQSAMRSGSAWIGDLADMDGIAHGRMYKVRVSANCSLTVTGTEIAAATPISLTAGWNWAAYYPSSTLAIGTALNSITGQVQQARWQTQSALFNGSTWTGDLTQMEPGQGYTIRVSGSVSLIYPNG